MAESSFLGVGWAFPADVDQTGNVLRAKDTAVIDRSIELILGTAKGERLMRPDFGSDLQDFLFKPLSDNNKSRMATVVKDALMAWERRIRVLSITVTASPQDPATALISIDYEVRSSNTKGNLVYPFYLQGVGS